MSTDPRNRPELSDLPLEVDEGALARLRAAGLDDRLARHVAHLFVRDPLVVFRERVELDDERFVDHWESLQSTNWNSVRWKPPPPGPAPASSPPTGDSEGTGPAASSSPHPSIGWRVEARTMEVQLTDYENAAYTVFIALLSRAVLFFDLSFYLPMSLVDANMHTARGRSAARLGRFWFRKDVSALSDERGADGEPLGVASRLGPGSGSSKPATGGRALGSIAEASSGRSTSTSSSSKQGEGEGEGASGESPGGSATPGDGTPASDPSPRESGSPLPSGAGAAGSGSPSGAGSPPLGADGVPSGPWELFSLEQIMLGKGNPRTDPEAFPGLVPLLYAYLELIGADQDDDVFDTVDGYLRLVASRARGEVPTAAEYLRAFVRSHPGYKGDSVLSHEVAEDLCAACAAIAEPHEAGAGPGLAGDLPR